MIRTSVVVISWNGASRLGGCLDALLAQIGPDDEIIVVDNGSTDSSTALVRQQYPQVRMIENQRNLGFAGGYNVGVQAAQSEYLLLVNQDVVVREGWLEAILAALASPEVGIVGCKLLCSDGTIRHAGGSVSYPLAQLSHCGYHELDQGQWRERREVDFVGEAIGLKRAVLDEVGPFDEGFFPAGYEDVDLCFRARSAGHQVVYTSEAVGTYRQSTVLDREGSGYHRWMGRGRLRYVLKHYTRWQFYDDFVPAEYSSMAKLAHLDARQGIRMACLDTLLSLRGMPRTGVLGEDGSEEEVAETLLGLRDALTAFPERSPETTSLSDLLVEPPWRVQDPRIASRVSGLGRVVSRLRGLWDSVWRLQEKLAVVQEILVCLDREMTEGRRLQAGVAYGLQEEVDHLKGRVRALEEALSALSSRVDR
jgi:GT2 family glycosyltransferase